MTKRKPVLAWYFSDETRRLRYGDGREIALGVEHTVKGRPKPCKHGLHGSESILDALQFAPGKVLWRVELSGRIKRAADKIAATRRRYVSGGIDVSGTLRRFACDQALSVAHLWDMPAIVREYLETMDESKLLEARDAANAVVNSAVEAAAEDAAFSATWNAALSAAWAARNAARAVALAAASRGASSNVDAALAAAEKHLLDLLRERHGIE